MAGPYGQGFQLAVIKSHWNKKTPSDEKFLENRKRHHKIAEEFIKTLPNGDKYVILLSLHLN